MLGHALAEERRKLLLQKPKVSSNYLLDKLTIRPAKIVGR